jgi:tetratricopeptide (TPR) repeat protein
MDLDPRYVLEPKDAAMCLHVFGHYYELNRADPVECLIQYGEAWRLDIENEDYRQDVQRIVDAEQGNVNNPFRCQMIPKRIIDPSLAEFYEQRAKNLEKMGNVDSAMTALIQGRLADPRRPGFYENLMRLVVKEYNDPTIPTRMTLDGPLHEDARNVLPPDGKAMIFAARGDLFEAIEDYLTARHCYASAMMCAPYYVEYHAMALRTDAKIAEQKQKQQRQTEQGQEQKGEIASGFSVEYSFAPMHPGSVTILPPGEGRIHHVLQHCT